MAKLSGLPTSLRQRVLSRLVVEKLAREKSAVVPHEFPQIA